MKQQGSAHITIQDQLFSSKMKSTILSQSSQGKDNGITKLEAAHLKENCKPYTKLNTRNRQSI